MERTKDHREAMIRVAAERLQANGFYATSLHEVMRAAGAPRGSLYHYFQGGKLELACAALIAAGEERRAALAAVADAAADSIAAVRAICDLLAAELASSGFHRGCPLATAMLDTGSDTPEVRAICAAEYAAWEALIAAVLARDGVAAARRARLAALILSAVQGALLLARTYQSPQPLESAREELTDLLSREISQRKAEGR